MVVDATAPSLVLLAVLVAVVAGGHLVRFAVQHAQRRTRAARRPVIAPPTRCRRVVLLDERWPLPVA